MIPILVAKQALVDAANKEGLNAFYGWPPRTDNRGCVIVGTVSVDYERASLAARRRIRDQENWDIQVLIVSGQHHRSPFEAEKQVMELVDQLVNIITEMPMPESVLWLVPDRGQTVTGWDEEARHFQFELTVSAVIRQRLGVKK